MLTYSEVISARPSACLALGSAAISGGNGADPTANTASPTVAVARVKRKVWVSRRRSRESVMTRSGNAARTWPSATSTSRQL
ncbi:hypothetical protein G6F35_018827 [Rhizopus arrhizus]|nr:hypothetical protein G6F32_015981 [Rhizopus arrhizus]KAG1069095.1 hypothetical protein G6F40_017650 [Rhizopus arrhizus]KAG1165326.1 hypothetical protein G6F35_018827 [Rhizopus arrhizus]